MIIVDRPPNFNLIKEIFPRATDTGVMFAYNGNIYNPSGKEIPLALIAHENVHLKRQEMHGADDWWSHYLYDSKFRYHEELLAHAAEFAVQRISKDRNAGAALLLRTALRLIAPLYNYEPKVALPEAIKDLKQELKLK